MLGYSDYAMLLESNSSFFKMIELLKSGSLVGDIEESNTLAFSPLSN